MASTAGDSRREGARTQVCRYSAGKMVVGGSRGFWAAVLAVAQRLRGLVRRQFLTRNRRLAFVLAVTVAVIGAAAVRVSVSWFSPGVMILPFLAGGRFLGPGARRGGLRPGVGAPPTGAAREHAGTGSCGCRARSGGCGAG